MTEEETYARSDLAYEKRTSLPSSDREWQKRHGIEYSESERDGVRVAALELKTGEAEKLFGKSKGRYITVFCGNPRSADEKRFESVAKLISENIILFARELTNRKEDLGVLIVGLGNRYITSDALGPKTTDKILVTRHLAEEDSALLQELGMHRVSALAPGVLGQTGIETVELVRGAVELTHPDLVIVIDALAARSCETLAATVQLSNTGTEPGSGIGNRRKAIDRTTLGVPVISIGVPTVVDSSTLVYDALKSAGIDGISEELRAVLENGKSFYVSPKDADVICDEMAKLLSYSIDLAMEQKE